MFTWDAVSALDRMFDDVMGSSLGAATNQRAFDPEIDVRHNDDEVLVVCDVPGVKRDDLDITLEGHVLTIKGVRKYDAKEKEQVLIGRRYGAFARSFTLPQTLDTGKLAADLADGVLTIAIPRHPKSKPFKIHIGGASEKKQLTEGKDGQ
jgi:HSP20 family protein